MKEATKNTNNSQILLENLARKKKVVLEKFSNLKEIIEFFGLNEEYEHFVSILTDKKVEPYQFAEICFENLSEEKMLSIGNSINEIVHVFSQSLAQKEKEMNENRVPSEVRHTEKIDQQLGSFTQKTFHVPENDIRFLVSTLSKQVTEENRKYFMGMPVPMFCF